MKQRREVLAELGRCPPFSSYQFFTTEEPGTVFFQWWNLIWSKSPNSRVFLFKQINQFKLCLPERLFISRYKKNRKGGCQIGFLSPVVCSLVITIPSPPFLVWVFCKYNNFHKCSRLTTSLSHISCSDIRSMFITYGPSSNSWVTPKNNIFEFEPQGNWYLWSFLFYLTNRKMFAYLTVWINIKSISE